MSRSTLASPWSVARKSRSATAALVLFAAVLALLLLPTDPAAASHSDVFLITPTGLNFGEFVVDPQDPPAQGGIAASVQVCGVVFQLVPEQSCPQAVNVTNVSDEPQPVSVTGALGQTAHFSMTSDCPASLAPGASCQLLATFNPDSVGPQSDERSGFVSGQHFRVRLTGTGLADPDDAEQVFLVTPTGFDFGEVVLGATVEQAVNVTNISSVAQETDLAGGAVPDPRFGGFTDCGGRTLAPGESCRLVYSFSPTGLGPADAATSVTSRSVNVPIIVQGIGIAPHPLVITNTALPDGVVGQPYSATLEASGGLAPYTWDAGLLPEGLTLDPGSGVISGTPVAAGDLLVQVQVLDKNGTPEAQSLSITVREDGGGALTPPPSGPGVHLATWSGGTIEQLLASAPGTVSLWATEGGALIGYIAGAPPFVNSDFLALFTGGQIPQGTPLVVVRE